MTLDRSRAPAPGARPPARIPAIGRRTLANGARVLSAPRPISRQTTIEIALPAGRAQQSAERIGVTTLAALTLVEGTRSRSTIELLDALDALGAELHARANDDELRISLRALDRNLDAALALLAEVLFEPRFAPQDFERQRKLVLARIASRGDDAAGIAGRAWRRLLRGETPRGWPLNGTEASVRALGADDARAFFEAGRQSRGARVLSVGPRPLDELVELLAPIAAPWPRRGSLPAACVSTAAPTPTQLYVIDKPGAPQSELRIGHASVAHDDPALLSLSALNYALGGTFTSRLNTNLREHKGYTYGARSGFEWSCGPTEFVCSTAVQTRFTASAVREIVGELRGYLEGPSEAELAFTHSALEQALARQFESPGATLGFIDTVDLLGWPDDFPLARLAWLERSTSGERAGLLRASLHPDRLTILVVGDRAAVEHDLVALELGPLVALDIDGVPPAP